MSSAATTPAIGAGPARALRFADGGRTTLACAGAAIVVLPVVFSLLNAHYATLGNVGSLLRQASVLLLVGAASTTPILMGTIDLSVGAVVSLTAIAAGLFAQAWGQGAVFLALPVGLACGLLNGAIIALFRLPSFLVTLGTSFAFGGAALAVAGGFPVSLAPGDLYGLFNGTVGGWFPASALWALVVWIAAILLLARTTFGRFVYMVGGNERACLINGVNVPLIKILVFGLGGLLNAFAGILVLFQASSATSSIGDPYLLTSIAAVVIGGTPLSGGEGGMARTVIGTLVLVELVQGMFIVGMSSAVQQMVEGGVVIVAMLLTLDRRRIDIVK